MPITATEAATLRLARRNKGIVPLSHTRYLSPHQLGSMRQAGYLRRQRTGTWKITQEGAALLRLRTALT